MKFLKNKYQLTDLRMRDLVESDCMLVKMLGLNVQCLQRINSTKKKIAESSRWASNEYLLQKPNGYFIFFLFLRDIPSLKRGAPPKRRRFGGHYPTKKYAGKARAHWPCLRPPVQFPRCSSTTRPEFLSPPYSSSRADHCRCFNLQFN